MEVRSKSFCTFKVFQRQLSTTETLTLQSSLKLQDKRQISVCSVFYSWGQSGELDGTLHRKRKSRPSLASGPWKQNEIFQGTKNGPASKNIFPLQRWSLIFQNLENLNFPLFSSNEVNPLEHLALTLETTRAELAPFLMLTLASIAVEIRGNFKHFTDNFGLLNIAWKINSQLQVKA